MLDLTLAIKLFNVVGIIAESFRKEIGERQNNISCQNGPNR